MKTIYKSLMTIAFAGLSLASCDKELKEETAMEVPCNVQLRWRP